MAGLLAHAPASLMASGGGTTPSLLPPDDQHLYLGSNSA
jgi:hypothetical protein